MEIKQVGDLIPYHKSLAELWDKEEFQPVLALLSSLYNESVDNLRRLDAAAESKLLRAQFATYKAQLNLANMLLKLPNVIQEAKEQIKAGQSAKLKFVSSQETGGI